MEMYDTLAVGGLLFAVNAFFYLFLAPGSSLRELNIILLGVLSAFFFIMALYFYSLKANYAEKRFIAKESACKIKFPKNIKHMYMTTVFLKDDRFKIIDATIIEPNIRRIK